MIQEGKISIWLGHFDQTTDFEDYIYQSYSEDGDSLPSEFMTQFEIEYYDQYKFEAEFNNTIKEHFFESSLLFSYSDSFNMYVVNIPFEKYNCAICLYDFEYYTPIKSNNNLDFIGSFAYSKK